MDFSVFNDISGQLLHLFVWSSALVLVLRGITYVNPHLQYWSALWKVSLLLCLLPLVPWSQLDFVVREFPVVHQYLPELPKVWLEDSSVLHTPDSELTVNAEHTAWAHLFGLTALSLLSTSLFKLMSFGVKQRRFNQSLSRFEALAVSSTTLAFMTEQQKAFLTTHKVQILKSEDSTSPFVTGIVQPKIVLPTSFFSLSLPQQKMLLEHEITHIKRQDLIWLMLSQLIQCLLWFTPAVHFIKSRIDLAIEVECDGQVLDIFPDNNKEYGNAILNIVRHTNQGVQPQAAFFINHQFSALKSRIKFTQKQAIKYGDSNMNKLLLMTTAVLFSATSWALNTNPQNLMSVDEFVKLHKHASRYIDDNQTRFELSNNWVNPVQNAWVSSAFKLKQKIRYYKPHLGIDLATQMGEPIVAARDGVVIIADDVSLHQNHGNVVVIDHGQGILSMYSHMGSFDVKKGDTVEAGQRLGKVGVTGKSTGPHLHFEIIAADRHVDPASVIEFN